MHTILNGICKLQEHKQESQSLPWQFMEASYPTLKEHVKTSLHKHCKRIITWQSSGAPSEQFSAPTYLRNPCIIS